MKEGIESFQVRLITLENVAIHLNKSLMIFAGSQLASWRLHKW